MVLVPMGHKDQIRGKVIAFPGIGIDIDYFPFVCDDPEASVSLVQEPVAG